MTQARDVFNHQLLLIVASLASLVVPFVLFLLMKKVPGRYMHGYEAVYKVEKERQKAGASDTGIFAGLRMLVSSP